ncbi:SUKH-4 family immunity protein [Streptomyces sp. V4-01]|uniref:SUKH-4 family immunity protein n=1 Tax=Actinacidiphila polyblastidii TaxID=3110430 RepID=A0ABU7PES5_9ACTN|nr:SUKH-4 family immunity protein [Streptomyces sp. V4-01]
MVTFAQAQERAERWINADVPAYETREIRVREFDLGFVVWSEAREGGPLSDDGLVRVIIARDSGEATLWPALPVGELIRRYEEEYGPTPQDAVPEPPQRLDLEATSFLLSPPQWLQDAADRMGIPDRRGSGSGSGSTFGGGGGAPTAAADGGHGSTPQEPAGAGSSGRIDYRRPGDGSGGVDLRRPPGRDVEQAGAGAEPEVPAPADGRASGGVSYLRPAAAGPESGAGEDAAQESGPDSGRDPGRDSGQRSGQGHGSGNVSYLRPSDRPAADSGGWAGKTVSDSGEGQSVPVPATVFAPPVTGADEGEQQAPVGAEARTELLPGGSALPRTMIAPGEEPPAAPRPGVPHTMGGSPYPPPGGPSVPLPPPGRAVAQGAADIADLETAKAVPGSAPRPAGQPARGLDAPPPPPPGAGTPPPPPGGDPHDAATMFATPGGTPPPPPPGPHGMAPPPPGSGGGSGDPHYAATMLATPGGTPPPPPPGPHGIAAPPPPPGAGGPHYAATMMAGPVGPPGLGGPPPPPPGAQGMAPPPPPAYGYPQAAAVPTVGPGYMAVLRYRGHDGSEQQLIRRSAPGTPHPEWQILHELRSLNVRPEQVLELHTELESCDLPGGYCTRMIRETWPQVRISHTAPYGKDHASRRQGVRHLLTHQGELHQVAGAPARPQPQRVPMPDPHAVVRVPPVGLDVIGQELAGAFGPQGVFRFDQRAVSRAGVPDIVAQTLMWSGLPVDFGPFFWAQAQPGQPVPTLAELAAQRGVRAASDAGSYLVMGNDFGRQLCVQYGTAHIVALPLEAGPGGAPAAPPQFVNSSLPEFARCLALLGRMWRLRIGLTPEQAGRWTVDFQAQLAAQDPAAIASPENWWSVLIEQMWDGLL